MDPHKMMFFDIETAANEKMIPFLPEVTAPGNYKDPVKIASYILNKREKDESGMPLDIDFARIRAFSWAMGINSIPTVILADNEEDERVILGRAWANIRSVTDIAGWNIRGFDLPILLRRAWALGVDIQDPIDFSRYGSNGVHDFMEIFYHGGNVPGPRARPLKFVAWLYGIDNPLPELNGSMVKDMDSRTLIEYAANDVVMVQKLARRLKGWYW
jgi:DNA polymerase elongation subunit (family B)